IAGNPQAEALLAQQGVAAVVASHRPNHVVLGKVTYQPSVRVTVESAMHAPLKIVSRAQQITRYASHPGHDSKAQSDVETVGQLDPDFRQGRPHRTEHVGHPVHRSAFVRTSKPAFEL